jgi:ArsR family transcriptional regulator, virulence genes transcriptional regulator
LSASQTLKPKFSSTYPRDGMASDELVRNAGKAAALLGVLGNEKRFAIMCHLQKTELSVGAIAEKVSLSQSALSQHLAKLRAMNLVQTRRDRQTIYYSSDAVAVEMLIETMERIFGNSPARRHETEQHNRRAS